MITVKGLTKTFRLSKEAKKQLQADNIDSRQQGQNFNALIDVNFQCEQGKVLGLLGPNGAGKTTTLRLLASALKPDSGQILIDGVDIVKKPKVAKKRIGFLTTKTGLYNRLTAKENIEYFGKLQGLTENEIKAFGEPLYHELQIEPYLHRRIDTLSSGMLQKVSIARAVIHQPDIIVLDEPTTGLDIMATEAILSFISRQKDQGKAIIFSTHHLDEVEQLADNIAIIAKGTSCFYGSVDELLAQTDEHCLRPAFMQIINARET